MKKTESVKKSRHRRTGSKAAQKKQQRQSERAAAKQQLKRDPMDLSRQEKREYYGWD